MADRQLSQLQGLFRPGDWELQNPKILESDRAILLFQNYFNRQDGQVNIDRCTMIFPYEGPAKDEEQRLRQSIVLRAPRGAVLKFDQPFDLNKMKVSRLVGGQLNDQVTIHSDWKDPGPEDDLWIVTHNVVLAGQTISTANPVNFSWGPHYGRGRDMVIKLLSGPPAPGGNVAGLNASGVESFEMQHVERLHLDLGQATVAPGQKPGSMPVEITCRGPFRFDVIKREATFSDGVEVMRPNPAGPADQLDCDKLTIYFVERPKGRGAAGSDRKAAGSLDLMAQRIEARGNPVVAKLPSLKDKGGVAVVRGQRLEYDLATHGATLDEGQEVFLQQGPDEIHTRSLHYQPSPDGRMGQVDAQGPGWFRGEIPDRPGQQVEAAWNDRLQIYPRQQYQEIALTGGATLGCPGMGQIKAREIFFWMAETPAGQGNAGSSMRPKSMLARNNVCVSSPRLSGTIAEQTRGVVRAQRRRCTIGDDARLWDGGGDAHGPRRPIFAAARPRRPGNTRPTAAALRRRRPKA